MKLLLDECIPRKLKRKLLTHDCRTVPEEGFAGKKNGALLNLAEKAGFQAFLTIDRAIEHQQNLESRSIAIIFVRVRSGRLSEFLPLTPAILSAIESIKGGQLVKVGR